MFFLVPLNFELWDTNLFVFILCSVADVWERLSTFKETDVTLNSIFR